MSYLPTAYQSAIGIGICLGLITGLILFGIVFGDRINDRNRSRQAQKDETPIVTTYGRDLVRSEAGFMRISFKVGLELLALFTAGVVGFTMWATDSLPEIPAIGLGDDSDQPHITDHRGGKATSLKGITIVEELPVTPEYDREAQFGDWVSTGDGCDMRQQILRRDLTKETLYDDGCTVSNGLLDDPYTGDTIIYDYRNYFDVQIDHVVPLGLAWDSGAYTWDQDEREHFANDPHVLLAVDGPTNSSKSDQSISEWLPPDESYHCDYFDLYLDVIRRYDLVITQADAQTVRESSCP